MNRVSCQTQNSTAALDPKTMHTRKKVVHHYRAPFFSKSLIILFALVNFMIGNAQASDPILLAVAKGIGYREQELQLAKGAKFSSEVPNGVKWASFNGGTHIFFKSVKLNLAPEKNVIWVYSEELKQEIPCPPMTEEDIFNSQPAMGSISYRLPSITQLFNLPPESFDHLTKMNFIVSVHAPDEPSMNVLSCGNEAKCKLTYQRDYTPTIFFISPRVTYYESITEVWFNPQNTLTLIEDLDGDELPFINAKIGGNQIDFEDRVDSTTSFSNWNLNTARGQIGEGTIAKDQNITMMWETGNAAIQDIESKMCDFNNTNCYQAKSIPVIFEISENVGYTTGGQNITVKGFGFDAGKVHAVIDGQNCTVTSSSRYEFDCTLQPKQNVSDLSHPYQGQHGATRFFTNSSVHGNGGWLKIQDVKSYNSDQMLALDLQAERNIGDKIASLYKTWFVPPETGRYRFYMSCDQQCRMYLAQCPNTISPLTKLVQLNGWTGTRAFFSNFIHNENEKQYSEWINLTKGEPYYMEVTYVEYNGGDHMSTGVEFEQTAIVNHHHAMKEIQELRIFTDQTKEKTIISVKNPDTGSFRVTFKHPNTGKFVVMSPIKCTATAAEFKAIIKKYYWDLIRSDVLVTRLELDADGNDITIANTTLQTIQFEIEVVKLIATPTTAQIIVSKVGSTATVTAKIPADVQLSSPPISGKFDIICVSDVGQESKAINLDAKMHYFWIAFQIQQQCVGLYNKIEGLPCDSADGFPYVQNGMCVKLRFNGFNGNPGQFRVQSSESSILAGKDVATSQRTITPYGTNLFYNPIPFEMLRTYEEKPQFLVTVDEQPVACHNMTCDYTYVTPVGEITGTTYDDSTRKLIITGVDLPTLLLDGTSSTSANSTASATTTDSTSADTSTAADAGGDRRRLTEESTTDNSTSTETSTTSDNSTSTAADTNTTAASSDSTESASSSSNSTTSTNATTSSSDNSTTTAANTSSSTDNSTVSANSTTTSDSASNSSAANSTTDTNSTASNTTAVVTPAAPEPEITLQCDNTITSSNTLNNPQPGPAPSTIRKIRFGQMDCEYDAAASSSTKIECTLKDAPVCGIWKPEVIGNLGRIPNADALVGIQVNCTVTQIQPDNLLNVLGADNLTIIGTNFPRYLEDNTVDIEFSNTPATKCIAQRSNSTHLICLTKSFNKTAALGQSWSVKIVVNNVTVENTVTVKMKEVNKDALQILPPTASPVLKTKIQFKLQENFPFNLTKEDFTVNVTLLALGDNVSPYFKHSQNTNVRRLNVIKVYNDNLTIETMFGGAYSGTYSVQIRHTHFGLVDTSELRFVVGSEIHSISPRVGSVYGGQLLTIAGTNWDSDPQNNPVSVVFNGALGAVPCYVQTTSREMITCRIQEYAKEKAQTKNKVGKVVVFLKTSEEASCTDSLDCDYTFTDNLPNVTAIDKEWDTSLNVWTIKLSGTDFTGNMSTSMLTVGGIEQPAMVIAPTTAQFKVTNAPSKTLAGVRLYLDIGIPEGDRTLLDQGVALTPKFVGISSNKGSKGGSIIVLNVQGVGSADEVQAIQYVDSEGADKSLCSNHSTIAYGKIECRTVAGDIPAASVIKVLVNSDAPAEECANTDTNACKFEQTDSEMPVISNAEISSASEITFTGTSFFETGYNPVVEFGGVTADNITVVSDSSIVAKWIKGVPVVVNATAPILSFEKLNTTDDMSVIHFASGQINITNALNIIGATTDLACSFSGGCKFEVQAKGLATLFRGDPENNFITICDRKCIFQDDASTDSMAQCLLPEVSTTYSDENFKIAVPSEDLKTGEYFGTFSNNEAAFDDILTEDQGESTVATGNCSIGMSFKPGHVGLLSQVKWFMGDITSGDTAYLVDNLIFQGSDDNVTYTDIFNVDESVHEGWNYHRWEKDNQQKFRFYRFQGEESRVCLMNEIKFTGVETIDNDQPQFGCDAKIEFQGTKQNLASHSGQVTYKGALTPKLVSITPRFGPVTGSTDVTFSGSGFSTVLADNSITIDGVDCPVKTATEEAVVCTTGKRFGLRNSTLVIKVANKGDTALQQKVFRYVSYWSDDTTWGGEFAPMEMESVYVPTGLNLFVDVDSTPMLNTLIVEGSLIFAPEADPDHQRTFDAHIIFVRNGKMEVGTEEFPYTSKITITMHSDLLDPYLPIYGNKVIGCRFCELDMHGPERIPTWTMMEETAEAGADKITLKQEVDWRVGELIGVASTDFNGRHAEKRTIIAIDRTNPEKPIITMDKAFEYKHYAATETYGDDTIDMRAEVGLLSRNVKFQGDEATSPINQYGATIFLHSLGDDSLTARLGYIEMTNVGQAFKVGRYAVHFHMIGAVHTSYANGCSTHEGNNRAFTIHGTHYLRISRNVVYGVKGHNIFIEDAAETKNIMSYNLIMKTMRSMSLLNTDATPGSFWITHPDNALIGNHAGGSDRYAYWYDLQDHAMGPSANMNICSRNARVGEFRNNSAHSNGRYGLRVFHNMVPREFPCRPIVRDFTNETDPYHANRPITANFNNFTAWKCGRNGAIAERVGVVKFNNFKVADHILAGIEFEIAHEFYLGDTETAGIYDALVIGKSNNTESKLEAMSPHGVITPRSDGFSMRNIRFHNFNWYNWRNVSAAAIGDCSHCIHDQATDSGSRTVRISQMQFFNVNQRIRYQIPFRGIFKDFDGTTTGQGANSWATTYRKFHEQPGCQFNSTTRFVYNGIVCDSSVTLRRVSFVGSPGKDFDGMGIYVLKWDDDITSAKNSTELESYYKTKSNWDKFDFKLKQNPGSSTTGTFVIGHKYRIHWGQTGIDFEKMTVLISEEWVPEDKSLFFVHNFTDVRAEIQVKDNENNLVIANNTIPDNEADYVSGQNFVFNNTIPNDPREQRFSFIINGKNQTRWKEKQMTFTGTRCIGSCNEEIVEVEEVGEETLWSNPKSWPSGKVPVADEDVHVESGWNMTMDVADTPIFNLVRVNGLLNFKRGMNITFRAKHIFVRAGEFHVGSKENPFTDNCNIILYGDSASQAIVYDNAVEAGNKVFANLNVVKIYGKARNQTMTRLQFPALKGATNFTVEKGLDLVAGDRVALLATSYENMAGDDVTIESYDTASGLITVNSSFTLNFYHWGAPQSTGDKFGGVDMRGEVIMLSRNIKIIGEDIESWGGHFMTGDTAEISEDGTVKERIGNTYMDWVEFHNMSQIDTDHAALRFINAAAGFHEITNCSLHNGFGWAMNVKQSNNILIKDNRIYNFRPIGVMISDVKNVTVDRNVVAHIQLRTTFDDTGEVMDEECGICTCSYYDWGKEKCENVMVTNNIVAGTHWVGMTLQGYKCNKPETSNHFGNVIHSVAKSLGGYGAAIHPDSSDKEQTTTCFESSGIITYKNEKVGVFFGGSGPQHVIFKNMTGIDNALGLSVGSAHGESTENNNNTMQLHDSRIYGESPLPDCPQNGEGGYCFKDLVKCGFSAAFCSQKGREFHPRTTSGKPMHTTHSFASWGTQGLFNNNTFANFYPKTSTGAQQNVFCIPESGFDKIPPQLFRGTTLDNVAPDAMAYISAPQPKWANLKDCGAFPCTGPLNVLFSFIDTKYSKGSILNHGKDFQLISNNTGLSPYLDSCEPFPSQNAYICHSNSLGLMQFESLDDDKKDRGMQPVFIGLNGSMQSNKLNSFMDNTWDGFYAGQIRLSRFPALIDGNGGAYNISFTGSPAKKLRFIFNSNNKTAGMTIRIAYPGAESRSITINDKVVEPNKWDDKYQMYGPITQSHCGENRYIGVKNILEFYLVESCEINIIPRDAIQSLVRMEWSLDAFFSNGGTTSFMDRVAAGLGIHASTIKIVSVYEGSLVVNYEIGASDPVALAQVQAKQTQAFATNSLSLGAPILDVSVTTSSSTGTAGAAPAAPVSVVSGGTVSAPGYDPIIITKTVSNDPVLAAAAAASATSSGTATTTTTVSTATTAVAAVTNRVGSSSYGVINSSGAAFQPNVQVVVNGNTASGAQGAQGAKEAQFEGATAIERKAEQELLIEEELYEDMELMQGGSDSGGLIVIISVVVLGLIGTVLLTLHMINTNKHKRIIEANRRQSEMLELSSPVGDIGDGSIPVKHKNSAFIKKLHKGDFVVDQGVEDSAEHQLRRGDHNPLEGIVEYGDQYNANHDFAIFQANNERLGGLMNLAQKQNQADCVADKSMSVASSFVTERGEEDWAHTEREGEDSKTPMNKDKSSRRKSVKFGASDDGNELPENQEWAEL